MKILWTSSSNQEVKDTLYHALYGTPFMARNFGITSYQEKFLAEQTFAKIFKNFPYLRIFFAWNHALSVNFAEFV